MTILFLQTHNICVDCVECYGGRGELRCRSIVRVFTIITFNCHRLRHREEVSRGESHRCHAVQLQRLCPAASSPRCKVGHHTCNLYGVLSVHGAGSEGSLKPAKIKTTRESVRVWDNEEIKTRRGIKKFKKTHLKLSNCEVCIYHPYNYVKSCCVKKNISVETTNKPDPSISY